MVVGRLSRLTVLLVWACTEHRLVTTELCDGIDNDGDDWVDEGFDQDRDGWASCAAGARPADCNDDDSAIFPGAPERCDGLDSDCDGTVPPWELDLDGDLARACDNDCDDSDPSLNPWDADSDGHSSCDGDCDDLDPERWPGREENCNGLDDDCDGWLAPDERDKDGDGEAPCAGDCDDDDPDRSSIDVDEDGVSRCAPLPDCDDEDPLLWLPLPVFADNDGDGHGDPLRVRWACAPDAGESTSGFDCDDTNASVAPGAAEQCNGIDDDCDGVIDEDLPVQPWFSDSDGDGFGDDAQVLLACDAPADTAAHAGDCIDLDDSIHPGAPELCNGVDDDCDGVTDEPDAVDATTWYPDGDRDGYGDGARPVISCGRPSGHVPDAMDCDDDNRRVHPGAANAPCNGIDEDCDPSTPECP
jgi:hypothetical protein